MGLFDFLKGGKSPSRSKGTSRREKSSDTASGKLTRAEKAAINKKLWAEKRAREKEGYSASDQAAKTLATKQSATESRTTRAERSRANKKAWAEKNAREAAERRIQRERAGLLKSPIGRRRAVFKTKAEYDAYRETDEWKTIRNAVKERAQGKCEICGKRGSDVHHRRYRPAGRSRNSDFLYVCRSCHRGIHGTKR